MLSALMALGAADDATAGRRGERAAEGSPRMVLEESAWDFGDVERKGGDVSHEFVFRNEGTRPLVIFRVVTSCSCVKAHYSKRPIAPGGKGTIRITYEPHKAEPGVFNKVVQIHTNATPSREIVTVKGNSIDKERRMKIKIDGMKIKTRQ